jgi:Ca-activated chloride channel family protein
MWRFLVVPLLALALPTTVGAQEREAPDKTLSPYFFVKGAESDVDRFPLKATRAQVDIAGVIARVKVTQVYANEGQRPLEGIYIFPGSTRAAVHGMKMTIGERTITARIEERQEARRQYNEARDSGRTASLLEQQRPNVFQMNVANILPGDEVKVELTYTELLVPDNAVYEFVYPTVVGPRYARPSAGDVPDAATWTRNPYLRQGEKSPATFQFQAQIVTAIPLKEIASPSHQVTIDFPAQNRAAIRLAAGEKNAGTRDVVVRYRLAGDRIEAGVLLSEGSDENFFVCMLEPPRRFSSAAIPPREYVFVMDVSGSMNGFPIETSKQVLRTLLDKLRPTDYFNVIFFSGGSYLLSPTSLEATELNKNRAANAIERQRGGGGTELLPALQQAVHLERARPDIARVIVVATDGYVNVEREAFTLVRNHLGDASVFTFGIGSAVNRHLIEGMARVGKGLPFVVLNDREADAAAARFVDYIESPLLTRVEVHFTGFAAYDLEPAFVPDLFADRPIVVTGKFRGTPGGEITVTGFTGQGRFERTLKIGRERPGAACDGLKYLWARERVALLSDYASVGGAEETGTEVTRLGLKYGILTQFTSFVAVDEHVRSDGQVETVRQPLPLPEGVSNLAVGESKGIMPAAAMRVAGSVAGVAQESTAIPADRATADIRTGGGDRPGSRPAGRPAATPARIEIAENRLEAAGRIGADALRTAANQALGGAQACFAGNGSPAGVGLRFKVVFAGGRQPVSVELLEPERWKQAGAFVRCVGDALAHTFSLPSAANGYLVVTVKY